MVTIGFNVTFYSISVRVGKVTVGYGVLEGKLGRLVQLLLTTNDVSAIGKPSSTCISVILLSHLCVCVLCAIFSISW